MVRARTCAAATAAAQRPPCLVTLALNVNGRVLRKETAWANASRLPPVPSSAGGQGRVACGIATEAAQRRCRVRHLEAPAASRKHAARARPACHWQCGPGRLSSPVGSPALTLARGLGPGLGLGVGLGLGARGDRGPSLMCTSCLGSRVRVDGRVD